VNCSRCRIRKAVAGAGLCVLCLGIMGAASPPHHDAHVAAAAQISGTPAHAEPLAHDDQPHPPEAAEAQPIPGAETAVEERHVLVVDDPRYGVLNGRNYIGYCATCPAALQGALCYGPCPD
jgi:hypothetical protein